MSHVCLSMFSSYYFIFVFLPLFRELHDSGSDAEEDDCELERPDQDIIGQEAMDPTESNQGVL